MSNKSTIPIIALCIFGLLFTLLQFSDNLIFSQEQIHAGQWWRLWTGHFVHVNDQHLMINMIGLSLFYLLYYDQLKTTEILWHTLYFTTVIGLLLFFLEDDLFYAGLSGVLYGKYTIASLILSYRGSKILGYLVFALISVKVITEQLLPNINQPLSQLLQAPIANQAHLYGYLSALFLFSLYWLIRYRPISKAI